MRNECGIGPLDGMTRSPLSYCVNFARSLFSFTIVSSAGGPCRVGGRVNNDEIESRWSLIEREQNILAPNRRIDRRNMSRATVLGMLASQEALKQSGWLELNQNFNPNSSENSYASSRAGKF